MANIPIKVLLDKDRSPFIPFSTTSSIVENGTNRRLDKILGNLDDLQTNNKNSLVSAINEILVGSGSGAGINIQIVDELPTENISLTTIYFKHMVTTKPHNVYEEWMYINDAWELIGTTEMDLSGYATTAMVGDLSTLKTTDKDSVVDAVNELVDKQLVAGNGIELDGNTINLSGSTIKTLTEDPVMLANLDSGLYLCKSPTTINHWGKNYMTGAASNNTNAVFPILVYKNVHNQGCAIMWDRKGEIVCFGQNQNWASYSYASFATLSNLTNYISKTNTTSYTPTTDYHPATKKYVDDKVAEGSGSGVDLSNYLAKDNTIEFTPTADYNPSTKKYVDDKFSSVPLIDSYTKTEVDTKLANYLAKDNLTEYTPTSDYHPATKKFVETVVSSIDMSGYYNKTEIDSMIGNVTKSNITFWTVAWKSSPYYILPSSGGNTNLVGYVSDTDPVTYSHVSTNKYTATPDSENYIVAFKFTEPATLKNVVTAKTKTKLSKAYVRHYLEYPSGPSSYTVVQPTYVDVDYSAPDNDGFFDTIVTCYYDIKDTTLNKLLELVRYVYIGTGVSGELDIVCKKIESRWEIM